MKRFLIPTLVTVAALAAGGMAIAAPDATDHPGAASLPHHRQAPAVNPDAQQADVYTRVDAPRVVIPSGEVGQSLVSCPSGQVPTGGGYNAFDNEVGIQVRTNSPTLSGWFVVARNTTSSAVELWAIAICHPGTQVRPS
ncbi:hypothetical protein WEB32_02510 [Streptomyces netropsis]|uniref:Secreted protein n=1 Tax=Streptomyces netropsis TaxID=55404 RepID=A0A7W7PGJ7_STRNE|nr:hypothetical protein [Streptomyces netropsis]MBB4889159.1 hypothetical protein [Streptomyces netropsis]GGR07563.1 hypothetical protein GCM10010219_09610 [Streptomyces netropsis]